jgi:hypothetical protein
VSSEERRATSDERRATSDDWRAAMLVEAMGKSAIAVEAHQ